jgi:hypothetical protein
MANVAVVGKFLLEGGEIAAIQQTHGLERQVPLPVQCGFNGTVFSGEV